MAKTFQPWSPRQTFLLPPSPTEWLAEGHLAYFVLTTTMTMTMTVVMRVAAASCRRIAFRR